MIYLLIFQALIFVGYVTFVVVTFKRILSSISESWYTLATNRRWMFSAFNYSLGVAMYFHDTESHYLLVSAIGFFFVGYYPRFKNKGRAVFHYFGATLAILGSLLHITIQLQIYPPIIMFAFSSSAILFFAKYDIITNKVWWIEVIAFMCIFTGLITNILSL